MSAFDAFGFAEPIRLGIAKAGWQEPTPVQREVIPAALDGADLLVQAATGSGKTGAFVLPMLERFHANPAPRAGTRALVLVPTRELARQVHDDFIDLGSRTRLTAAVIVGGEDRGRQVSALRRNPDLIVATPGRMAEHLATGEADLADVEVLVLDEADRMLDMGFAVEVLGICDACTGPRQTLLFSATLHHRGLRPLTDRLLRDPELISLDPVRGAHPNLSHQRLLSDDPVHKQAQLLHLLRAVAAEADRDAEARAAEPGPEAERETDLESASAAAPGADGPAAAFGPADRRRSLVFVNTRARADEIGRALAATEVRAAVLHGELDQRERKRVMGLFRGGVIDVLIASDVAARGLDLPGVGRVIHFDVPRSGQDYLHRSGRTGRAGADGLAIALVSAQEWNKMEAICRWLGIEQSERAIDTLPARFKGPRARPKRAKPATRKGKDKAATKAEPRKKDRVRERKNIGKRRAPSTRPQDRDETGPWPARNDAGADAGAAVDGGFAPVKRRPRPD